MPLLTVLTPDGVENIANHQYVGGKYTPLDNILNPWWLFLVDLLPMWLAPNLVTLLGFTPLIAVYILYWLTDPSGREPMPSYLLLSGSAALFFYQTMDAMDGKQARRTKSSTPLGQLFDHGFDCFATISHHAQALVICSNGGSMLCISGLLALQTGFFISQWEEYHTGILQTAAGPVGVTETQFGLMFVLLVAGLAGPERVTSVMKYQVLEIAGEIWQVCDLACFIWASFVGILILLCFARVVPECTKKGTIGLAFRQLLPIVFLNVLALAWQKEMRLALGRPVLLVIGLHFFYLTAQVITFSMAHQPFPVIQKSILPFAGLVAASHFVPLEFMTIGMACYAVAFGGFMFMWVYSAGEQISRRLEIRIFKIRPDKEHLLSVSKER